MHYNITVSYRHEQEQVHLAESPNLAEMKQLAELICHNALPEICWVKVEDGNGELVCYWMATPWTEGEKALLEAPPASNYIN